MSTSAQLTRFQRTVPVRYEGVSQILPVGFGPEDLVPSGRRLLEPVAPKDPEGEAAKLKFINPVDSEDSLGKLALDAAQVSYCPYSESPSGVSIELNDGFIGVGSVIESAAFNPTLSPVHGALINCYAHGGADAWKTIKRAVLVEKKDPNASQKLVFETLLRLLSPKADLSVYHLE